MMHSVFLGNYDDDDADWRVIAHTTPESPAPETFADPPDFSQSAGYDNQSDSDEDYASEALGNSRPGPKPGGYDSRIEQILYENPNLPILITDAGKGADGTKYIAYTIRTGVSLSPLLGNIVLTKTGSGSAQAILGICVPERRPCQITSYAYYPSHPRKTYYGRLCCEPHKGKARSPND